jgi:hypothetical protein
MDELRQINPERYKRLALPFENEEAFTEALTGFFKELGELREKYKIPDVLVAVLGNVKTEQRPEVGEMRISSMQYGDMSLREFIILNLVRQEHPMLQALIEGLSGVDLRPATDADDKEHVEP